MSNSHGKTWADFCHEHMNLIWVLLVIIVLIILYLLWNKWEVKYGDFKLSPPVPESKDTTMMPVKKNYSRRKSSISGPIESNKYDNRNTPIRYVSEVTDDFGKGNPNVEVHCAYCIEKKVVTNNDGSFTLEAFFDEDVAFWQSTITLSK